VTAAMIATMTDVIQTHFLIRTMQEAGTVAVIMIAAILIGITTTTATVIIAAGPITGKVITIAGSNHGSRAALEMGRTGFGMRRSRKGRHSNQVTKALAGTTVMPADVIIKTITGITMAEIMNAAQAGSSLINTETISQRRDKTTARPITEVMTIIEVAITAHKEITKENHLNTASDS